MTTLAPQMSQASSHLGALPKTGRVRLVWGRGLGTVARERVLPEVFTVLPLVLVQDLRVMKTP